MILLTIIFLLCFGKAVSNAARNRAARKETERIAMLKRLAIVEREQDRQRREQERQDREQRRQAAQIERQERHDAEMQFRLEQSERDIDFLFGQIGNMDAQRDSFLLEQSRLVPGSKRYEQLQSKIISIDGKIHSAEMRMEKAKHTKRQAEKELSAR